MKKLILTLVIAVSAVSFTFAQEATEIANSNGVEALKTSKSSGSYVFTLPSNVTKDEVAKSSKYYTHYFTVSFDAGTHVATLSMVDNTEKNRYVITRFLSSCGVRYVSISGENVPLDTFITDYLK